METAGHDVGALIALPVLPVPGFTVTDTNAVQPTLSMIVTVCGPAATLTKVYGDAPGTMAPPSNCQLNGAVPVNAVAVTVPLETAGHDVGLLIALPVLPVPGFTVTDTNAVQPTLSIIVTV